MSQQPLAGHPPALKLREYSRLPEYRRSVMNGVSLASTKKSFLVTHYHGVRFPVEFDKVCLPNALCLGYFDPSTLIWTSRQRHTPSLAHHCPVEIPLNSPFARLRNSPGFRAASDGPTSYEIMASQTKCPAGLSSHEYMAYQNLASGRYRRWLNILTELGSSNLNFSMEATTALVSYLVMQAGPEHNTHTLRATHGCLLDRHFCQQLINQIKIRLSTVSLNFRETNFMGMLLTLTLHLCSLADESNAKEGRLVLHQIREATHHWIRVLRVEIQKSTTVEHAQKCSEYAFWAALLCKRTFTLHAGQRCREADFSAADLQAFMESSILLQNSLSCDPSKLPRSAQNALIRDLKLVLCLRSLLKQSFLAHTQCLSLVMDNVWPQAEGIEKRVYSAPRFREAPEGWWITSYIESNEHSQRQSIDLHLLDGHLLINRRPLGKLPPEYRQHPTVKRLFGEQNLLTYPSAMPGMTHVVPIPIYDHEIHFGFRKKDLIVRAHFKNELFEFIPSKIFVSSDEYDLPASLVESCVHWFNLRSGVLEIRQSPDIWKEKPSNWRLDFWSRAASRRTSRLVDPRSSSFKRMASVFHGFEYANELTVFQPERYNITIELKRLEISFSINPQGYFYSKQLRCEIDPNQDAGTWYGLWSKLVLRNPKSPGERSIIVPLGSVTYESQDDHVAVSVANEGIYGRYIINSTLGRLECAPEPKLLYLKALLHACTSSHIPDTLTGRTGTEEALHFMRSAICRPWRPLDIRVFQRLVDIVKLSPVRNYYPSNLKQMQRITWDPKLSTTIQDDSLLPVVQKIVDASNALVPFFKDYQLSSLDTKDQSSHLMDRARFRRGIHQRSEPSDLGVAEDLVYLPRDKLMSSQQRRNVFEIASILRDSPPRIRGMANLFTLLSQWPIIGGFKTTYRNVLLSDLLNLDLANEWGSLINFCRSSDRDAIYRLSFVFGPIVFKPDVDMTIIRTLLAHYLFDDAKSFEPPQWPLFDNFRFKHELRSESLMKLMQNFCDPFQVEETESRSNKRRKDRQRALEKYEAQMETESRAVVNFLLVQWPCARPSTDQLLKIIPESSRPVIRAAEGITSILPEWLRLYQNWQLSEYLELVQQALNDHDGLNDERNWVLPMYDQIDECPKQYMPSGPYHLSSLLEKAKSVQESDDLDMVFKSELVARNPQETPIQIIDSSEIRELENLIRSISISTSLVKKSYGTDLMRSLVALRAFQRSAKMKGLVAPPENLSAAVAAANIEVKHNFARICAVLEGDDSRVTWLKLGRLWPCITPISILEQLRSTLKLRFGDGMKAILVSYAESITHYQRLLRLQHAKSEANQQKFNEELVNVGHVNWRPLENADWILLEIDGDFLIRPGQVEVAMATIAPSPNSNSVLQMNMGQGERYLPAHWLSTNIPRQNILYNAHGSSSSCEFEKTLERGSSEAFAPPDSPTDASKVRRSTWSPNTSCSFLTKKSYRYRYD